MSSGVSFMGYTERTIPPFYPVDCLEHFLADGVFLA